MPYYSDRQVIDPLVGPVSQYVLVALLARCDHDNKEQGQRAGKWRDWRAYGHGGDRTEQEIKVADASELLEQVLRNERPYCVLRVQSRKVLNVFCFQIKSFAIVDIIGYLLYTYKITNYYVTIFSE